MQFLKLIHTLSNLKKIIPPYITVDFGGVIIKREQIVKKVTNNNVSLFQMKT